MYHCRASWRAIVAARTIIKRSDQRARWTSACAATGTFVTEDDCCNTEASSGYWRSVHEVCYPNTKVDYSNIMMEVRFAEGVRVVNLNENRVWDYECRNGVNRTQYAYLP
ncbi:hypothetical protein COOONC_26509 [Cooperia oncophora]